MKKSRITIVSIILILLILTVYWPVRHYEFLNFDDQVYVTDNAHVRSGLTWDNVSWALSSLEAGFWHPMTWLSLMLDTSLYRLNAGGFHWTNVLLHIGSTLRKRLINRIFTATQNYVKDFSKRFEEEYDDTMAGEQG
jgi:hypothetical protein